MDKITISRWQGNKGDKGVSVSIESNGYMLYRGDLTIENFGHLISGLGNVEIERDKRCLISDYLEEQNIGG